MSEDRDPRRVVADIQRMLAAAGEVEKVQVRRLADEYAAWMGHAAIANRYNYAATGKCSVIWPIGRPLHICILLSY